MGAEHESEEGGGLLGAEKLGALARPRAACGRELCEVCPISYMR